MASIVKSLRLIADETRLRLLLLLEQQELSVVELQEILGMGQSRISMHLGLLRRAGLVQDRRAGKNIYYALVVGPAHAQIAALVTASAGEIPEVKRDEKALQLALTKRNDRTREYFNQLAGKFGRAYCPGRTWEGVAHLLFGLVPPMTIADLGAGEGTLAQLFAKRAKKVIAVDNSEKMVEFGVALAKKHGFSNLDFRLGDLEEPPIAAGTVDLALLSPRVASREQSAACCRGGASHSENGRTHRDPRFAGAPIREGARPLRGYLARVYGSAFARVLGERGVCGDQHFRRRPRAAASAFSNGARTRDQAARARWRFVIKDDTTQFPRRNSPPWRRSFSASARSAMLRGPFHRRETLEAPPGLHFVRCSAQNGATSATLHVVTFRPAAHTWAVMDNPEGASISAAPRKNAARWLR